MVLEIHPQVWELSRICPETSTKLHVHEFGLCSGKYLMYSTVSWMVSGLLAIKATIWGVRMANRQQKKANNPAMREMIQRWACSSTSTNLLQLLCYRTNNKVHKTFRACLFSHSTWCLFITPRAWSIWKQMFQHCGSAQVPYTLLKPSRFWLRICGDIRNRKSTTRYQS